MMPRRATGQAAAIFVFWIALLFAGGMGTDLLRLC